MSNSTGTRKQRDVQTRVTESLTIQDQLYIADLKVFSGDSISEAGLAGPNINNSPITPAGNYLAREGDSMIGPIALGPPLDFRIVVNTANTIVISSLNDNPQYSSNLQLDDFQTNSSVLDIIEGAAFDGQILILRTFAPTSSYTISQGTIGNSGNIQTGNSDDITLGDLQTMVLVFDESLIINANTGGTWRVISISDPTSGLASFPILWPKASLTPPASSSFTVDLSLETGNANQVQFPAGDISLQLIGDPSVSVGQEIHILFIQDGVGGRSLASVDSAIKNGANMDILLDKAANAKTMFKLVTLDGGVSYHAILIDLTTLTGGYTTIQDEGSAVTQRATMNFIGPNVSVVDNPGSSRTDITISTGSGALSTLTIDVTKSWLGFGIFDLGFVESNAPLNVGSGFIRMGTGEEIRMRNFDNTDDLVITSGVDAVLNEAIIFQVAGGDAFTISAFDIDVVDNDIIRTGDITPGAGAHQVGDSFDFYNQMHSQYFVPEGSAVITNRYGLAKNGNQLYVNFNDIDADAGFAIREEGIQQFLFSKLFGNVYEFFIGSDPFNSGEEYRIQLGENSNSSARISFTEGIGNDLLLDRAGGSINQGVQILVNGLSAARFLSQEIKIFKNLNVNAVDLFNVVDIKSNGGGGATTGNIGELITADGGFDYFMRSRLTWDSDPDTFIQFSASGIALASDDAISIASVDSQLYATTGPGTNFSFFPNSTLAVTIQDNAVVHQDGIDLFLNGSFVNFQTIVTPATPSSSSGSMYAKDLSGSPTPFWLDSNGLESNMLLGAGTGGSAGNIFSAIVKEVFEAVFLNTTLQDDNELKFISNANNSYYVEFNLRYAAGTTGDIKFGIKIPSGATYRIVDSTLGATWSASTAVSGGQTLTFSGSGTSTPKSANFFVVVYTGILGGEVALQWAQNTSSSLATSVQGGSLMRAYETGASSSSETRVDHIIGTADVPNDRYVDTGYEWFGNDNGADGLSIVLPAVEPAGFTISHTLTASDFSAGVPGFDFVEFGSMMSWLVQNPSLGTVRVFARTFFNGIEMGSVTSTNVGTTQFAGGNGFKTTVVAQVGDIVQLRLWGDAIGLELRAWGVYMVPTEMNCTSDSCTINLKFNNESGGELDSMYAAAPASFAAINLDNARFLDYGIGGGGSNFFTFTYGNGNPRMVKAEYARPDVIDNNTVNFSSSVARWPVPLLFILNQYSTVN